MGRRTPTTHRSLLLLACGGLDRRLRTELDLEHTLQALELRELLAAGDGVVPAGLAPTRPSTVQGIHWIYDATHASVVVRDSLELARRPDEPSLEFRLPLGG